MQSIINIIRLMQRVQREKEMNQFKPDRNIVYRLDIYMVYMNRWRTSVIKNYKWSN